MLPLGQTVTQLLTVKARPGVLLLGHTSNILLTDLIYVDRLGQVCYHWGTLLLLETQAPCNKLIDYTGFVPSPGASL